MTMTYIGYQSAPPDIPVWASLRESGKPPPELARKVNGFPASLPPTCKIVGSWFVPGPAPNVVVVEVESLDDLQHIDNYYAGWVIFDWHPCRPMPRDM